ncbi:putative disease resistance protein [Vitis vinifera]|uniref:Putative disease resistance protein n=1 Tax=Vitis vinifera TaxID=29760 RepID=A0A438IUN4_VITVI|nr:putative disease resistance protein [Vitis vinifera]
MVSMQLHDCKNCSSLPSLGQLGSLKELSIMRIDGVQKVGQEFYGNIGSSLFKPFGSLEILRFEEMLEWEEWVCREIEFPCLKELYIKICPKLKKDLPKHLPKLTKLEISECEQLVCCLPMAPSILELMLGNVMMWWLGVRALYVSGCPELKEIAPILHNLTSLKHLEIKFFDGLLSCSEMGLPPMLERLGIVNCPILKSLPEGMIQSNTTLNIEHPGCKKLELSLPEDMTHNHYAFLTQLSIHESCDSLTSFPLAFFTKLETLHLWNCGNLESLYIPDGLHHVDLTSLQGFLSHYPRDAHPPYIPSLFGISSCPEIDSFPEGGLPTNLSDLHISNCNKLLANRMDGACKRFPFLEGWGLGDVRKKDFPRSDFCPPLSPPCN